MTDQLRQRLISTTGGLPDPSWDIRPADWQNLSVHTAAGTSDNGAADFALLPQQPTGTLTQTIHSNRVQVVQHDATYVMGILAMRAPYVVDMTKRFSLYYCPIHTYSSSYSSQTGVFIYFLTKSYSNSLQYSWVAGNAFAYPTEYLKGMFTWRRNYVATEYTGWIMPNKPVSLGTDYTYPGTGAYTSTQPPTIAACIFWDWDPSNSQWKIYNSGNVVISGIQTNGAYHYKPTSPFRTYTWDYTTLSTYPNETEFCPAVAIGNSTSTSAYRGGGDIVSMGVHYY